MEFSELSGHYREWLQEVSKEFKRSQIKAAVNVNSEMLRFYYYLGCKILELKNEFEVSKNFYEHLSTDLQKMLPDVKSFSPTNIKYMQYFFTLYSSPQVVDLSKCNFPSPQLVDLKNEILQIPWGHHRIIIDKCGHDREKALFYVHETIVNNWSRAVLFNFLDSDLYTRKGKAITNFQQNLPKPNSDLAQALTKDPYTFDFITLTENYNEKELKDALMDNITKFLLELGNGFAFVGREVRLLIGETENFVDMLFYNIKLHCYVVVEVKISEFDARDMGQLATYMVAVNHQLKGEHDEPTLGLLICKSKDNVKARYALEASSQPMGISQYDVNSFMPAKFKSSLPTIGEIEKKLDSF